jgi:hypothetical protein
MEHPQEIPTFALPKNAWLDQIAVISTDLPIPHSQKFYLAEFTSLKQFSPFPSQTKSLFTC